MTHKYRIYYVFYAMVVYWPSVVHLYIAKLLRKGPTGKRNLSPISPTVKGWPSWKAEFRIDFNILLFVFKALQGQPPLYISELLSTYSAVRPLRSTTQQLLAIPKTCLKTRGDRAFSVIAPKLWNSLPLHNKSCNTIVSFKTNLKTHFYSLAFLEDQMSAVITGLDRTEQGH